ncbi:MAG: zinc-dependent metalloproteinase lipoprotein [Odoribacter sp.]
MKARLVFLLLFSILCIWSCAKDEPAPQVLKISENSLHFSGNGGAWQLTVKSNSSWKISGQNSWCTSSKTTGNNTEYIMIKIDSNDTKASRTTRLLVSSDRSQAELTIEQDTASGNYHYTLPVIFHIFYGNEADSTQNIRSNIIHQIIEKCNDQYRKNINSVNMNTELVAATEDPHGNILPEPGIERILKSNAVGMSCNNFMAETNTTDVHFVWDLNKYINVFVFKFKETNISGISHLPYTPRENSLVGLVATNTYYTQQPNYVHCISLNGNYINEKDAYQTLAHELGHYLGLFHTFVKENCDEIGDYCDDTESYNRAEYETWLKEQTPPMEFLKVVKRTACGGSSFTSHNVMDYYYSYLDQFTPNQYSRIRHVLENSPLTPGPKNVIITRAAVEYEIPEVRFLP